MEGSYHGRPYFMENTGDHFGNNPVSNIRGPGGGGGGNLWKRGEKIIYIVYIPNRRENLPARMGMEGDKERKGGKKSQKRKSAKGL